MATQAIEQQVVIPFPQQEVRAPNAVREFFSAIVDLAGVYFGGGVSIAQMDSAYRANLSAKEKTMINANMNGVWTN